MLTLNRLPEIDHLVLKFDIIKQNKFMKKWLARILIAELLWGNQYLKSSAKEVEAIKYYEEDLRDAYLEVLQTMPSRFDPQCKLKFTLYLEHF